ncbi:MAG: amidase [Bradymonadales bacterium]|nr:amidase [Bradymonadales bacterium]
MSSTPYKPQSFKAPVASGGKLKLLAGLIENKVTGAMLGGTLLRNVGVMDIRATAATDAPWLLPPPPPDMPTELAVPIPPSDLESLPPLASLPHYPFETAADFVQAYRDGRLTPEQVAERVLKATDDSDQMIPPMRWLIAQKKEDVMQQAAASTRRYQEGTPLGPLDGVPVLVKDEFDQEGYPTTVGTRIHGQTPAEQDAFAVSRLRAAGAILIGKANMHEIGLGVTGLNPHHGSARNPYHPGHATGGSSSGSAAAVAGGLCPVSVGADGGGSIRIPAALCGIVGLKATYGRISERGVAPVCWSVAHLGPFGASVRDVALAYGLMAGPDPHDEHTYHQPSPRIDGLDRRDLSDLTLGVFDPWFTHADEEVVASCQQMCRKLEELGAKIIPVELPELELLRPVHMITIVSEMAASQMEHYQKHRTEYGLDVRINFKLASLLSVTDYIHAQRLRFRLCRHFHTVLKQVDAILTPTTACTAPPISEAAARTGESNLTKLEQIMRFTPVGNLTGLPAISFPAGYDSNGLPIGLHAIGRMWAEHTLLRLAAAAEPLVERKTPRVHFQLLG